MKKTIVAIVLMFALSATSVSAHVVVKPNEVGVAAWQNFVVSVPTEEDNPTVGVRLVLPDGLQSVRPNVKQGWAIELVKSGESDDEKITEIIWSGGSIPAEQRDEFVFNSQASSSEGTLVWKAYQTYSDGTVVAWENDPSVVEEYEANNPLEDGEDDHNAPRPYSQTTVVNDLAESQVQETDQTNSKMPMIVATFALILGAVSLGMQFLKKK